MKFEQSFPKNDIGNQFVQIENDMNIFKVFGDLKINLVTGSEFSLAVELVQEFGFFD